MMRLLPTVVFLVAASAPAFAKDVRVTFPKGGTGTTVKGSIAGDATVNYRVGAAQGQTLRVTMTTDNGAAYFNVFEPGKGPGDAALFIGSTAGNSFDGTLPAKGDYTVQVYLMRSAARRHEKANYALEISVTGAGDASGIGAAPAGDARVRGTPYHATGSVPCSMGAAPEGSAQCKFGVIRGTPGNAEVHVTPPGGFERVLTFAGGKVTSEGATVKASKSADLWSVDVDDHEHYRIPDAVISGG